MSTVVKIIAGVGLIAASIFVPGAFMVGWVSQTLFGAGLSVTLGGAAQALAPKPKAGLLQDGTGRQLTVRQAAAPRRMIYGFARVGGILAFLHQTNNGKTFHLVATLAGHAVSSIDTVMFDGIPVEFDESGVATGTYAGKAFIEKKLGFDGDQAFATLQNDTPAHWTENHRQRGCAAVYIRLEQDDKLFPRGLPNISFLVNGKLVYDPRIFDPMTITAASNATPIIVTTAAAHGRATGDVVKIIGVGGNKNANGQAWKITVTDATHFSLDGSAGSGAYTSGGRAYPLTWTNLAPLCAADYATDGKLGLGADYDTEIDEDVLIAGCNVSDEPITLPDENTENRYTINGTFESSELPGEILQHMANAMGGWISYVGGKFLIIPGAFRLPALELTDDDVIGPIELQHWRSMRELVNGVKGKIINPDKAWQETDFPPVSDAGYLAEDGGEQRWKDIYLPFTVSAYAAQRLAKIDLERNRRQIAFSMSVKMRGYIAQPGDVIEFTHPRLNWSEKTFEVIETALQLIKDKNGMPALAVQLALRESDVSVYGFVVDDYGETLTPPDLDNAFKKPPAPDSFSLTANNAGKLRLSFKIPENADYRGGHLVLLADQIMDRSHNGGEDLVGFTLLNGAIDAEQTSLTVNDSSMLKVGRLFTVATEILKVIGPGDPGEAPTSNTIDVARAQKGTAAGAADDNATVRPLEEIELPFRMRRNYSFAHPNEYYEVNFFPGRFLFLHAELTMLGINRDADSIEQLYNQFVTPSVAGSLPGQWVARGRQHLLRIPGPLREGEDMAQPLVFAPDEAINYCFIAVETAPEGQSIKGRLRLEADIVQDSLYGPTVDVEWEILPGEFGSGVFFRGDFKGSVAGKRLQLVIDQVGTTERGRDLTLYVQV